MGEKEAFCLLLWASQGGVVSNSGKPVITRHGPSGMCDDPTDCYRCPLLQAEISLHPPGHSNWVCPPCLPEISKRARALGKRIHLTGHYAEGQCQYIGCSSPPRIEYRDVNLETDDLEIKWTEADLVERPRGYSRLLQLVIGDINT